MCLLSILLLRGHLSHYRGMGLMLVKLVLYGLSFCKKATYRNKNVNQVYFLCMRALEIFFGGT